MRILNHLKLKAKLSAPVLTIGLSVAGLLIAPALAQATLGTDEIAAIQLSLKSVLKNATDSLAIEAAIANAEESAIKLYGSGLTAAITSTVMDASEKATVDSCTIGRGLGKAASNLAPSQMNEASSVATTIANEGKSLEQSCFQTVVNKNGYANLASIAGQNATPTGGTGGGLAAGGGLGGGFTGGGAAGGGGGGCLNPSCTKLQH